MPERAVPMNLQREIGKKKPFDVPEEEAFLNIFRTSSQLSCQTNRFLRAYGLTEPQYNALRIVRGHGSEGVPSQTIGEQLIAQVPDITRLVDRLCAAGLVDRARIASDRRVVMVRITRAGQDLLGRIDRPILDLHREQLGHLSRSELKELNRLLCKARQRLDDGTGPAAGTNS